MTHRPTWIKPDRTRVRPGDGYAEQGVAGGMRNAKGFATEVLS